MTFYEAIPPFHSIAEITDLSHYRQVPPDWSFALTDVRNSTEAIQNGQYKQVNSVAVASIAALLNLPMDGEIPFVFGGDGSTVLIPPELVAPAEDALLATQRMARDAFNLELRIGIVPVQAVLDAGYEVRVGRLKISENFQQAVFMGGGMIHAESLLKHDDTYQVLDDGRECEADFSGFECRWREVPSAQGESLTLIVQALAQDIHIRNEIYRNVLGQIEQIYGDADTRHPISVKQLQLALLPGAFTIEARIRWGTTSLRRLLRLAYNTLLARIAMRFDLQGWGAYKALFIRATDHEKFDDTLRMVIAGTPQQQARLREYLEHERGRWNLVYGMHVSHAALVTCIVSDYFGRQVHFVDGASGGYALAARELKAQLSSTRSG